MKKGIILALAAVNVVLLAVLLLGASTPSARAQVVGGGSDYILHTAQIGSDWDAVWITDLRSRRMVAFRFDKTDKELKAYRGRDLRRDFGRRGQ